MSPKLPSASAVFHLCNTSGETNLKGSSDSWYFNFRSAILCQSFRLLSENLNCPMLQLSAFSESLSHSCFSGDNVQLELWPCDPFRGNWFALSQIHTKQQHTPPICKNLPDFLLHVMRTQSQNYRESIRILVLKGSFDPWDCATFSVS